MVEDLGKLEQTVTECCAESSNLITVLNEVQKEVGYLPVEAQEYIADELKIPLSKVYGVATFYAQFSLEPKGKYVIHACDGTACHVRGSQAIIDAIRDKVGLEEGSLTTDDRLFTLETVSCIGACGLAPVLTINGKVYGKMSPDAIREKLDEIIRGERSD